MNRLIPSIKPKAPVSLREHVLSEVSLMERRRLHRRMVIRRSLAAAAVLVLIALPLALSTRLKATTPDAVFTEAISKLDSITTLDMTIEMRTVERENFEAVMATRFVSHRLRKSFVTHSWRLEKPGRTQLYDGKDTYMWIKGGAAYFERGAEWNAGVFTTLLQPQTLMRSEVSLAREDQSKVSMKEDDSSVTLTIVSRAKGIFNHPGGNNQTILESDHRRIYTFDRKTHLLQGLQIDVMYHGHYKTVLRTTSIRYNQPLDQRTLTERPSGLTWLDQSDSQLSGNQRLDHSLKPEIAVRNILQSMADQNIQPVKDAFREYDIEEMQSQWFGLRILSIGKSYQSGSPVLFYVPCRVALRDGSVKNYKLALRCDNDARVWVLDGGI